MDYYAQDLEMSGYKLSIKWPDFYGKLEVRELPHPPKSQIERINDLFNIYPRESIERRMREQGLFGGFVKIVYVKHVNGGNSYVSFVYAPAYQSMLSSVNPSSFEADRIWALDYEWRSFLKQISPDVTENDIKNNDGYPKDPVVRGPRRLEWVEKAMWKMGFSRSHYTPSFPEKYPHLAMSKHRYPLVGTIGHVVYPTIKVPARKDLI